MKRAIESAHEINDAVSKDGGHVCGENLLCSGGWQYKTYYLGIFHAIIGNLCQMKSNFHPSAVDNKVINTGSYRFQESFYDVPCDHLAKNLLGHILVRQLSNGKLLKGKIVETECYPGGDDKASHSFQGKITERNSPMYMKPAVRLNDRKRKGLHGQTFTGYSFGAICESLQNRTQAIKSQFFFLNAMAYIISENLNFLSTVVIGPGTAVLLRAVEPLEGMDFMLEERNKKRKTAGALKPHQLANGPSKLCISMSIDKESCNAQDLSSCDGLWIEPAPKECHVISSGDAHWLAAVEPHRVVTTSRIGIDSRGKEWASKPYRFYVLGNTSVSKRDKVKEKEIGALIEILERKRQRLNSSP